MNAARVKIEPHQQDVLERCKYEAKHHREMAARMRRARQVSRDPIERLKLYCSINERVRLAQLANGMVKAIRQGGTSYV